MIFTDTVLTDSIWAYMEFGLFYYDAAGILGPLTCYIHKLDKLNINFSMYSYSSCTIPTHLRDLEVKVVDFEIKF